MPLWLAEQPLVLASRSDVRGKMLAAAGLWFEIRPAELDERAVEAEAGKPAPVAAAQLLARAKASAVSATESPASSCSAPTRHWRAATSVSASRPTAPPPPSSCGACAAEATNCIRRLRWCATARSLFEHTDSARLTMRDFGDDFIATYLDAAGSAASASVGGYQLEGIGVHLFERVEGDYFTILGLPLLPLLAFLRQNGWVAG